MRTFWASHNSPHVRDRKDEAVIKIPSNDFTPKVEFVVKTSLFLLPKKLL